jgi:hypothetical protein
VESLARAGADADALASGARRSIRRARGAHSRRRDATDATTDDDDDDDATRAATTWLRREMMRSPERADFVVKVRDATRRDARRRACRFVRNRPAAAANANAD